MSETGSIQQAEHHLFPKPLRDWWTHHVIAKVEHRRVVEAVQEDGSWSNHYLFMTLMSAGIAVLGLLLSSPAVVIGAMLISPLMGPIIGLGFALATFDSHELRRSAIALAIGTIIAILFCALIVLLSPLQTVTSEIAARTKPNLFDLLVALFSGLAGTYATIRGRHGTIVGVAIATALMPPLAVVGFGLATANWTVFGGAFLLFFTNLMTIAASAAFLARIYGFAANLSPRQTGLQATLIIATLIALAVPLALSLKQIAWEALASRQANEVVGSRFGGDARVSDLTIDYNAEPIAIDATVLTPNYRPTAEREAEAMLRTMLRRPVKVSIEQFRVGTAEGEAEARAVAAARTGGADRRAGRIAERLALVAGVSADRVLIDAGNRRAIVRAVPLPGATLATYRALEDRVAATERDWSVQLVPPALALPDIAFSEDAPTEQGAAALRLAAWAGTRVAAPIGVGGGNDANAEAAIAALREAKVDARRTEGTGPVSLRWLAPDAESRPSAGEE